MHTSDDHEGSDTGDGGLFEGAKGFAGDVVEGT